jgi:hypothetical protein
VPAALETTVSAPVIGKALKEELAGLRSYRIGKLRSVHRLVGDQTVEMVAIGPRRYIYEETYRKIQGIDGEIDSHRPAPCDAAAALMPYACGQFRIKPSGSDGWPRHHTSAPFRAPSEPC